MMRAMGSLRAQAVARTVHPLTMVLRRPRMGHSLAMTLRGARTGHPLMMVLRGPRLCAQGGRKSRGRFCQAPRRCPRRVRGIRAAPGPRDPGIEAAPVRELRPRGPGIEVADIRLKAASRPDKCNFVCAEGRARGPWRCGDGEQGEAARWVRGAGPPVTSSTCAAPAHPVGTARSESVEVAALAWTNRTHQKE